MVGWHYRLNGLEFEQTLGDSERQGSLVCCSPWGHKESELTQGLKNHRNINSLCIYYGPIHMKKHLKNMIYLAVTSQVWHVESPSSICTPVLLPGKSHGQRSLVGYSPWSRKGLDTTERLHFTSLHFHLEMRKQIREAYESCSRSHSKKSPGLELEPNLNIQLGQGFVITFWLQEGGSKSNDRDLTKWPFKRDFPHVLNIILFCPLPQQVQRKR